MAFSTQRGRPRAQRTEQPAHDFGTPELRLKQAMGLTSEPIDLCLEARLITERQHWCGLHLRWLYTLRYGAPSLTFLYAELDERQAGSDDPEWRMLREREYHTAIRLLKQERAHDRVMRLAVFNERPAFLNPGLREKAWQNPALAAHFAAEQDRLREGLELLVHHWRKDQTADGRSNQPPPAISSTR